MFMKLAVCAFMVAAASAMSTSCANVRCPAGTTCVEARGQGAWCKPDPYNCYTREVWTAAKQRWCCANKGLGCGSDPCAGVGCLAVVPECREGEVVKIPEGECCPRCVPLEVGDVCRSGGVETGPLVDNSAFCPEHTVCRPKPDTVAIGGEVPWTCQQA